jgi:hypothetical protein
MRRQATTKQAARHTGSAEPHVVGLSGLAAGTAQPKTRGQEW